MKNIAIIIATIFLLSISALGNEGKANKNTNKKSVTVKTHLAGKFSSMIGYPSSILNEANETVMISYSVDENDVIHVNEISSTNAELKNYVLKHLDGKKIKNLKMEGQNGIVKVQFNGTKTQKLNFQY